MKRSLILSRILTIGGVCALLGALAPVTPAVYAAPADNSKAGNKVTDDPNLDPDYLYLNAFREQSQVRPDKSNYRRAIAYYNQALARRKNFYDALYNRAVCNYQLKQYDQSIKDSSRHIELRPNIMQAYLIRAKANVQRKNYEPALVDLGVVEQHRPDLMEYDLRGKIYFGRNTYDKAASDFEHYLAQNRDAKGRVKLDAIGAYLDLGESYDKLNAPDKAVAAYGDYISAYPAPNVPWQYRGDANYDRLPDALDRRGDVYLGIARKSGDKEDPHLDQAEADYKRLTEAAPKDASGYIGLGNVAIVREDWKTAVAVLDKAVALAPTNDSAAAALGAARRQESVAVINKQPIGTGVAPTAEVTAAIGELQKSIAESSDALRINPSNTLALSNRALADANPAIGNYAQATEDFSKLLTLLPPNDPRLAETYFNRGTVYANAKPPAYDKAVSDFSTAISADPKNTSAYVGRADSYAQLGQYDKAVADYDLVINGNDASADTKLGARRNRGVSYLKASPARVDEAITDFEAYLAAHPDDKGVKDSLFDAQLKKGPEIQLAALNKRISEEPDNAQNYLSRAVVYDKLMRYDDAVTDYRKVIQLKPDSEPAYQNLAADFAQKGYEGHPENVDAGIEANTKLIALAPTNPTYLLARGDLYNLKKQYAESATDYKKGIALLPANDPARAATQYLVANQYLRAGDKATAKAEFDTYFATAQPNQEKYTEALIERGDILLGSKDYAGAIADYSKYLAAKPGDAKVLKVRGQAYLNSGNEASALSDFEAAVAAAPTDAVALTGAGSIYYTQASKLSQTDPNASLPLYKKSSDTTARAIAADPTYAAAYYYHGLALGEDADVDNLTPAQAKQVKQDAVVALNKFVELAPSDPQVARVKKLIETLSK